MLIGRSVHDTAGACAAADAGASYVLASHIFDTPSKDGTPGRGLGWLSELAAAVAVPVIALGGITVERVPAGAGENRDDDLIRRPRLAQRSRRSDLS